MLNRRLATIAFLGVWAGGIVAQGQTIGALLQPSPEAMAKACLDAYTGSESAFLKLLDKQVQRLKEVNSTLTPLVFKTPLGGVMDSCKAEAKNGNAAPEFEALKYRFGVQQYPISIFRDKGKAHLLSKEGWIFSLEVRQGQNRVWASKPGKSDYSQSLLSSVPTPPGVDAFKWKALEKSLLQSSTPKFASKTDFDSLKKVVVNTSNPDLKDILKETPVYDIGVASGTEPLTRFLSWDDLPRSLLSDPKNRLFLVAYFPSDPPKEMKLEVQLR